MQVEDGLSRAGADVEDGAVSVFDVALAGDLGCSEMATADDFRIDCLGFLQSREMFLRNDQHMRGSLRMYVFEGKDMLVFMNLLGRNFSTNDAAEEAAGGRVGHKRLCV